MILVMAIMLTVSPFFFGGEHIFGRMILFIGTSIFLIIAALKKPRLLSLPAWKNPDVWLGIFFLFTVLSITTSKSPRTSLEAVMDLSAGLLLFFTCRTIGLRSHRLFGSLLLLGGLILGIVGLISFLRYPGEAYRLFGPYRNSDGFGAAFLLPLLLAVAFFLELKMRSLKVLFYVILVTVLTFLFLTSAASAMVGIFLAVVFGFVYFRFKPSWKHTILVLMVVTVALLGSYGIRSLRTVPEGARPSASFATTGITTKNARESFLQRMSFLHSSLAMAVTYPWTGVGIGMWNSEFPRFQKSLIERSSLAHGLIPQYLGELGFLGTAAFLGFLASVVYAIFLSAKKTGDVFLHSVSIGLLALAITGTIDISWFYPSIQFTFWAFAGMAVAPLTDIPKRVMPFRVAFFAFALLLLFWISLRGMTLLLVQRAEQYGQRGDWQMAFQTASRVSRMFPHIREHLRLMQLASFGAQSTEQTAQAKYIARTALQNDPTQPLPYLLLGKIAVAEGDLLEAEELFRTGIYADPYFTPELSLELMVLLLRSGRDDEARSIGNRALTETGYGVPDRETILTTIARLLKNPASP